MGQPEEGRETKLCPSCAEQVQSAALICRYCRYDFRQGAIRRGTTASRLARIVVYTILGVALLTALGYSAAANPHTNIPVVSPLVCGLKGGVWVDQNGLLEPPTGCYESTRVGTPNLGSSYLRKVVLQHAVHRWTSATNTGVSL